MSDREHKGTGYSRGVADDDEAGRVARQAQALLLRSWCRTQVPPGKKRAGHTRMMALARVF